MRVMLFRELNTGIQIGVARIDNDNFTHHLANHDFQMLVGNFDTLRLVNLLNLFQDVVLNFGYAGNRKQFLRVKRTFGQRLTGHDFLADRNPWTKSLVCVDLMGYFFFSDLMITS